MTGDELNAAFRTHLNEHVNAYVQERRLRGCNESTWYDMGYIHGILMAMTIAVESGMLDADYLCRAEAHWDDEYSNIQTVEADAARSETAPVSQG